MLAVALSAVLASRLSKHIIKPVLAIDLEHPEDSDTYEELTPLLSRIKQQNQTIAQPVSYTHLVRRQQKPRGTPLRDIPAA